MIPSIKYLAVQLVKELPAWLLSFLRQGASPPGAVILMYHSINYASHRLVVTPDQFDIQLKYLTDNDWDIISLEKLVAEIRHPVDKYGKRKRVVLTFDDGYEDNFSYALEILKKYSAPATIFLTPGYIDSSQIFPWFGEKDGWAVSMNWDQIASMQSEGIEFGSHTITHPLLSTIKDSDVLKDEIVKSKEILEARIGPVNFFCYPAGDYTPEAVQLVRSAGYRGAVSVEPGFVSLQKGIDLFLLPRIEISGFDGTMEVFHRKITGCYIPFHKALQFYQRQMRRVKWARQTVNL